MNPLFTIKVCIFLVLIASLQSCKKSNYEILPDASANAVNRPPVANAGPDININLFDSTSVYLDGGNSSDSDNNIIEFLWTKIDGSPSSNIKNPQYLKTKVVNLKEGRYHFQLKVTDSEGMISEDTVMVTALYLDSLSGQEFIFNDLPGEYFYNDDTGDESFRVTSPSRPDLFYNPDRQMAVSVKFSGSPDWTNNIPQINSISQQQSTGYTYEILPDSTLLVKGFSIDYAFIGNSISIKVKF
jgi:hypothetical protein